MKILLFLFSLYFTAISPIYSQYNNQRILRVWTYEHDTIVHKIKMNPKSKEISYLIQEYTYQDSSGQYRTEEQYKKKKFWWLLNYVDIESSYKLDGVQLFFNEKGLLEEQYNYKAGEVSNTWLKYAYYPNGNLKFTAEIKNGKLWNIISYQYPDGSSFDYGTLKDGLGNVKWLNNNGQECADCKVIEGGLSGRKK